MSSTGALIKLAVCALDDDDDDDDDYIVHVLGIPVELLPVGVYVEAMARFPIQLAMQYDSNGAQTICLMEPWGHCASRAAERQEKFIRKAKLRTLLGGGDSVVNVFRVIAITCARGTNKGVRKNV